MESKPERGVFTTPDGQTLEVSQDHGKPATTPGVYSEPGSGKSFEVRGDGTTVDLESGAILFDPNNQQG